MGIWAVREIIEIIFMLKLKVCDTFWYKNDFRSKQPFKQPILLSYVINSYIKTNFIIYSIGKLYLWWRMTFFRVFGTSSYSSNSYVVAVSDKPLEGN